MSGVLQFGMIINALSEYPDLYERAIDKFMPTFQKKKAKSELIELLYAIERHDEFDENGREKATAEEVRDEIADVLIMATQLAIIFGAEEVAEIIVAKLERLEGLIQKGGEHGEL